MLPLDRWALDRAYHVQQEILAAYDSYQFHLIYQKIHNFCANEMGSLYLDITKDRQYTMQQDSLGRRSAQTAMYHIVEALVRWIAPVLSFTADELWEFLPGQRNESVLLNSWYESLAPMTAETPFDLPFWNQVFAVRDAVAKELENQRNAGQIKGGLTAEVTLFADETLFAKLNQFEDELKFVLITSQARLKPLAEKTDTAVNTAIAGLAVAISASQHKRCDRCWHQREEVGSHAEHPDLCDRCIDNIEGAGELRQFA
jgi:isoleucyl-tRNA synthetase